MKLLGVDTATPAVALGVAEDGRVVAEVGFGPERGHGPRLLVQIDSFLRSHGLALEDLDGFAAGVGPGLFTGLRIGIATVQGLALATGKPVVPVPTLQALAWGAGEMAGGRTICAMLDARRGEVYWALYRAADSPGRPPVPLESEAVGRLSVVIEKLSGPVLFVGEGAVRHRDVIARLRPEGSEFAAQGLAFPNGGCVARLGFLALSERTAESPLREISPRYVRPPDALALAQASCAKPD